MRKSKKICCRITPGRVVGTVLLAASAVNLIIVGAAFDVSFPGTVPTSTAALTDLPATITPFSTVEVASNTPTFTLTPSDTPTPTQTFTPTMTVTFTPTVTNTATATDTPSVTPTQCVPRYDWPIYIVQRGDTLYSLGVATRSSVDEIMRANCLTGTIIIVGQRLYVPHLPIIIPTTVPPTATFTSTPSLTPTSMTSPPSDTPTYIPGGPVGVVN